MKRIFTFSALVGLCLVISSFSEEEQAANCQHTGIDTDFCYASDGNNNYKVMECKPGKGRCFYEPVSNLEVNP